MNILAKRPNLLSLILIRHSRKGKRHNDWAYNHARSDKKRLYINERLVLNCVFLLGRIEPFFYKKLVDISTFKITLEENVMIYTSSQWKQNMFESVKYHKGDTLSFLNGLLHSNEYAVIPKARPEEYSEIWNYGELMHAKKA
jgi:hypothetical protein